MAKWFTDFSEYATNQQPSDWTSQWASNSAMTVEDDETATGGKVARVSSDTIGGGDHVAFTYDGFGTLNTNDYPIRIRARFQSDEIGNGDRFVGLNIAGGTSSKEGYFNGWFDDEFIISGYDNDSSLGILAGTSSLSINSVTYYQLLLEVHASGVRTKVWPDSESEPASWTLASGNTAVTSGRPAVLSRVLDRDVVFDWVGVGTENDDAPTEPVIPNAPDSFSLTTIDHESATSDWDTDPEADTYDLRWDTDDLFSNPTTISDIGDPPQVVGGLPAGRTVYAKVRACNENGCSDWSDVDSAVIDPPRAEISQRVTARQSMVLQDIEEISVTISQRATARQSVEAVPTMVGSIGGQVMLSGSPVEGAVVTIMHPPESETDFDTTTTDVNGEYSFDNLLVVQEGYHVSVEYRDNGNLYNTTSLPFLTPVAE